MAKHNYLRAREQAYMEAEFQLHMLGPDRRLVTALSTTGGERWTSVYAKNDGVTGFIECMTDFYQVTQNICVILFIISTKCL